jgi:hypothetical protein
VTEPLPQTPQPDFIVEPVEPNVEIAHRNNVLGLALFGLFLLIFGGTILIAFVYLAVA